MQNQIDRAPLAYDILENLQNLVQSPAVAVAVAVAVETAKAFVDGPDFYPASEFSGNVSVDGA